MDKQKVNEIVSTVFKALTLAMGVAVVVLSCLGSLEAETAILLLGIGLTCAGMCTTKGVGRDCNITMFITIRITD